MLNKLNTIIHSQRFIIATAVLILVFFFGLLVLGGLNQGTDLDTSVLIEVVLDHEDSPEKISNEVSKVKQPSKVEKVGTSRFWIYTQNVDDSQLEQVNNNISENMGAVVEFNVYSHTPGHLFAVYNNPFYISAALIFLFGFIYFAYINKGLSLTRFRVIGLFTLEVLTLVLTALGLTSIAMAFGYLGFNIEFRTILIFVLGLGLQAFISLFIYFRWRAVFTKEGEANLGVSWLGYVKKDWPTSVFVTTAMFVVILLPWLVFKLPLILAFVYLLFSLLLAIYSQLLLMPQLLKGLEKLIRKFKMDERPGMLAKEW